MVPWTHMSQPPNGILIDSAVFCTAHPCDQHTHTDRQTDLRTTCMRRSLNGSWDSDHVNLRIVYHPLASIYQDHSVNQTRSAWPHKDRKSSKIQLETVNITELPHRRKRGQLHHTPKLVYASMGNFSCIGLYCRHAGKNCQKSRFLPNFQVPDQGRIWYERVDPSYILLCQISQWSVNNMVPEGPKTANLTNFAIIQGWLQESPSSVDKKLNARAQLQTLPIRQYRYLF